MAEPPVSALAELVSFVAASPTPFHAVANLVDRLKAEGFVDAADPEGAATSLGHKLRYVQRDGSIVAWCEWSGLDVEAPLRILASHTDSPALKVKPRPDTGKAGWRQVGIEIYGNPLWNSWLDRELVVAGQLTRFDGSSILVDLARPVLRIPQLAIHLDRQVNSDGLKLNPQTHLDPVWGLGEVGEGDFLAMIAGEAGIEPGEVATHDLYLHHPQPPSLLGAGDELLAAPRLDNLSSVTSSLQAFLRALGEGPTETVPILVALNHEEIGSVSAVGAGGPMLRDVVTSHFESLEATATERLHALGASRCLSLDAMNATHPNYADRHDPSHHVLPNAGPALKLNANQRYASDAPTIAAWIRACREAGVPHQTYVPRNDMACGSTLGPQLAAQLGVRTVDAGIPVLSMHSIRELCGSRDPGYLADAATAFLLDPL